MLGVLEPQTIGNLADGIVCGNKLRLCDIQYFVSNMPRCGHSCFLANQIAEIIIGKMQRICAVLHGGHSCTFGLAAYIIFIQQLLETGKNVFVHIVACDKLAVIEACAIIEKHLDAVHNQSLAVTIYSMVQFVLYFVKAVHDYLPFFCTEMQRLVCLVGEKVYSFITFPNGVLRNRSG